MRGGNIILLGTERVGWLQTKLHQGMQGTVIGLVAFISNRHRSILSKFRLYS